MTPAKTTGIAYSYVRFSSPQQAKGDSLRRQTEAAAAYCRAHGLTLETSFSLRDLGVSAFKGNNATTGALGAFLHAITDGTVRRGSTLVIESLDRLSRQQLEEALELFLSIIRAGVRIVTLSPEYVFEPGQLDMTKMLIAIMQMGRAHDESATKSNRLLANWVQRRKAAAESHCPVGKLPAWCRRRGDTIVIDQKSAAAVRQVFDMTINGYGANRIIREFNRRGVAPIGDGDHWTQPYARKILNSISTFGDYQPCLWRNGKRVPVGEVIKGYYPAVIDENTFYRARHSTANRLTARGGYKPTMANLFTGLLRCSCGRPVGLYRHNRGKNSRVKKLLTCASWRDESR